MSPYEIAFNPVDQVILEGSLDDLVEYVRGNELVYICPRELCSERLHANERQVDGSLHR